MEKIGPIPSTSPMDRMGDGFEMGVGGSKFNFTGDRPKFSPASFRKNTGDDAQAPILLGMGGGLLFLCICLLCARLWFRLRPVSRLHLDDWTALGATILAIAHYALLAASVVYGLGRHARFVTSPHRRTSLHLLFISQFLWFWSITLVKLSVANLLLRIKPTRRWKIFLHTTMALLLLAATLQTAFQFLQCRPFSVYWDARAFRRGPVRCFARGVINANIVAFSGIQVGVDVIFSCVPVLLVRRLRRPRREKVFVCVLMGLGLFASLAAVLRTLTLRGFYRAADVFRFNIVITRWAMLELHFALIAATLPTLKAFMERVLVRVASFFYDEGTEVEVCGKLVQLGLLGEGEKLERGGREMVQDEESAVGGLGDRDVRGGWGDVSSELGEKEVEDRLGQTPKSLV